MTRELKLALIVGFVLVLLVTVLISDHFSTSRKSKLQSIDTKQPIAQQPAPDMTGGPLMLPAPSSTFTPAPEPLVLTQGGSNPILQPVMDLSTVPIDGIRPSRLTVSQGPVVGMDSISQNQPQNSATIATLGQTSLQEQGPASASLTTNPGLIPVVVDPIIAPTTPKFVPPSTPAEPERWYTIAAGDNTWKIAKRYYGNGELWRKLADFNGDRINKETGTVRVGVKIKLPSAEAMGVKVKSSPAPGKDATGAIRAASQTNAVTPGRDAKSAASSKPATTGRAYTIKKGDTLGQIASRELGSSKRYPEILAMNKGVLEDASMIQIGKTIALPAK